MIDRAGIAELIPHALGMCLLDSVGTWDDISIRCMALSHRDPCNPLRRHERLAALHLCEYGAQAMAVHGGLLAQREHGARAAPGVLAALRDVEFAVETIDDIEEPLTVTVRKKISDSSGWLYEFEVGANGRWLARGRVTVIHRTST
ncbi:MAG: hypothetical protein ACT4PZ_17550 [Panacagrimonas sp.]